MGENFECYKVFYFVAKYQNITLAAKKLFLSQSTVSRIIQNLEHNLGVLLFIRTKKGVTLTEVGKELFRHVSQACEHIYMGEESVNRMLHPGEGNIRVGTIEMVLSYYLMPVLKEFYREYPHVKMELSFQDPSTTASALTSGRLDVAILSTPFEPDDRLAYQRWCQFRDIMVAGEQYRHLKGQVYDLKQLMEYPFIVMRRELSARAYIESLFLEYDIHLDPMYEVGSMPFVLSLIKEGFGIGCVPEVYAREPLADGEIFEVQLTKKLPKRDICVVYVKGTERNYVIQSFLSHFQAETEK